MIRNVHIRQTQTRRLPDTLCETAVFRRKRQADERPSAGATKGTILSSLLQCRTSLRRARRYRTYPRFVVGPHNGPGQYETGRREAAR
jgi:hypothetical protein